MKEQKRWGRRLVIVMLFLATFALPGVSVAVAENNCFPAKGKFASQVVPAPDCTSPVFFCTAGTLTGALWGNYTLTADQFIATNEPTVPTVSFYTGFSEVKTRRGDLYLTDTGALNQATGNIAALLTITGGSDYFAGATGFLNVTGAADLQQGTAAGWYEGEICVQY